ncbi:MAG: group 1 glycosyl transferase [Vampirovibrio sp.]|jgi:glycosyltransferase involved in cell wall biosynthesis|nr:group 1 glycosyl transferase [Vampirovibrio sp.]
MRIAQVAPLWELVPPKAYGGTELVVHLLTEELVRRGHEVTLFAASGSKTSARLEVCAPVALRELEEQTKKDKTHCTVMAYELKMLQEVFQRADEFDVIHNHVGFQTLAFADFVDTPVVTTLHNALNPEPVRRLFYRNAHLPYISISHYQQQLWPELNYAATIHHGIDLNKFHPCYERDGKDYLAFLGRLSPEKGPHHAIRIAKELNMKLILAGKIDRVDQVFYDEELAHHVDGEQIIYIGELNHPQKVAFLRNAVATLCPVEWPEPFGLVMIESMACGTPVFALRDGSIPEVIDQEQSGYVADSVEELTEAVRRYRDYDRKLVRRLVEKRFSVQRMVDDHLRVYEALIAKRKPHKTLLEPESKLAACGPDLTSSLLTPSQIAGMKQSGPPLRQSVPVRNGRAYASTAGATAPNLNHISDASQPDPDMSEYYPEYLLGP